MRQQHFQKPDTTVFSFLPFCKLFLNSISQSDLGESGNWTVVLLSSELWWLHFKVRTWHMGYESEPWQCGLA